MENLTEDAPAIIVTVKVRTDRPSPEREAAFRALLDRVVARISLADRVDDAA